MSCHPARRRVLPTVQKLYTKFLFDERPKNLPCFGVSEILGAWKIPVPASAPIFEEVGLSTTTVPS